MDYGEEVASDESMEHGSDELEEQFDISLPASHSYMGPELVSVSGRSVLEPGWVGEVPVMARHGTVFPGETVPLLLTNSQDISILSLAISKDKLFGLLCPDESGLLLSGYGVLCEVFEVARDSTRMGDDGEIRPMFSCKARAVHRFCFVEMPKLNQRLQLYLYIRMKYLAVRVLPEFAMPEPLRRAGLASLDRLRSARPSLERRLRAADAATTPWPLFVYDMFDYRHLRAVLRDYFRACRLDKMPSGPVSLSFWAASNLVLSARERLALFVVDDALLRLHMAVRFMKQRNVLCCASCGCEMARREDVVPMSSEGVHSNYTNIGGYMHDIVTMLVVRNVHLVGVPTEEFSWFPGYAWTVANCLSCNAHVGWRFTAQRSQLRPRLFFALCRNYVTPRAYKATRTRRVGIPLVPHLRLLDDEEEDEDDV